MVKVIHFIHGMSMGGAETLVKDYALNLNRKKFSVTVLCVSHMDGSPYERVLMRNGIKMVFVEDYLWFKNSNNILAKAFKHFQRYFIVKHLLRDESPDILHVHLELCRLVKFARLNKGVRILYTVHSEPSVLWKNDSKSGQKELAAMKWLVKKYYVRFIVLHEKMRKEVNRLFGVSNSVVLNNGIDLKPYREEKVRVRLRKKNNIPEDAYVVGHVGRFAPQKNHELLVDVFAEISKKKSNAFLLMVGDGDNKDVIIDRLKKVGLNDKYLILSNRDDVPDILAMMDIFVFPSKYEGLGIALIEAQEAKLPCFVSETIPDHAIISNLVTRLSLGDGARRWADAILEYEKPQEVILDDANWDIRIVTKELEGLYLEAMNGGEYGKK